MKLSEQIAKWKELMPEEKLASKTELVDIARDQMSSRADRALQMHPRPPQGVIPLGVYLESATFPAWVGVHHLGDTWVGINWKVLLEHTLIVGGTGTGKTSTLLFWVQMISRYTDKDIFIIDGKGEAKFGPQLATIIHAERGHKIPISYIGHEDVGAVYDAFRGSADAIYNRLAELVDITELEGNATHFREMYRVFLRLVCNAPGGPPRSLEEVYERMSFEWVKQAWEGNGTARRAILQLEPYKKDLTALFNRIFSLLIAFGKYMGPEGFALDTARAGIFLIKTNSLGDDAPRYTNAFMSDTGDWIGSRMQRGAVLLIDEFTSLGNQSVRKLLRQGRSQDLAVVLLGQSLADLGDLNEQRSFLSLCTNVFVMNSKEGEELVHLAGTKEQLRASQLVEDGKITNRANIQPENVYRLTLEDIQALRPGEGYLLRRGQYWKLKTRYLGDVEPNPDAIAVFPKRTDEGPQKPPMPRME
jgi:hypothetical protein